jgi:ankyrin repeat protein/uncharacterized protein YegL
MENPLLSDLTCPITLEVLNDPISVPCCGKAYSRQALIDCFLVKRICPTCNAELFDYNPLTAAKNVVLASLIESIQNESNVHDVENGQINSWNSTIVPVIDDKGNVLPVSEFNLSLENSQFITKPSLFIAVVDRSGSMSGGPWRQVESALLHIMGLTRSNGLVKTVIVAYESFGEIIDTSGTVDEVKNKIRTMFTGGGTNFRAAFEKVKEVLQKYSYSDEQSTENSISNVTISFLTDGQAGERADTLVPAFQTILQESWPEGPLSVHSIGFGGGCDKNLLEGLRTAGSVEGTFRYSEPSDDADTLCHKLTSLFEVASKSSVIPMHIKGNGIEFRVLRKDGTIGYSDELQIQFPVQLSKKGEYITWAKSTNSDSSVIINTQLDSNLNLNIRKIDDTQKKTNKKIFFKNSVDVRKKKFQKWISQLVDDLASELLELTKSTEKVEYAIGSNLFELHYSLFIQKIEAIGLSISDDDELRGRLDFIRQQAGDLRRGSVINIGKLSDFRFASQFKSQPKKTNTSVTSNYKVTSNVVPAIAKTKRWNEITPSYSRNNEGKDRNELQEAIIDNYAYSSSKIDNLIRNANNDHVSHTDCDGNNALHIAAYCGQIETVKLLLSRFFGIEKPLHNLIDSVNDHNETALTIAIKKRGFHKTIGLLLDENSTVPSDRKKGLERYAIDYSYSITADILSNLSEDATQIDESMTKEYIMFSYNRMKNNGTLSTIDVPNYFRVCLSKLMVDMVKKLISEHGAIPTFQLFLDYCIPRKADDPLTDVYLELTELFLNYNQTQNNGSNFLLMTDENDESALFKAAERGSLPHVKLFIERKSVVDQKNNLGNTALWIACAKRYPCIIEELLNNGADVNATNLKGNPPMYSICQRGPMKIAETLLSRGASLEHINNNGDTLVLLCCRNGQHELLELFLNHVDEDFVDFKAHIDGFNAIFASVEANKPECIKVLHQYGVNVEQKTADDNIILPGATPLHLAAYYGRVESALVLLDVCMANPNSVDINGQTPLHIAVIQGNVSIITLLRNKKADISIKDSSGNVCSSYCRNRLDIREVLINPGLDILMKLSKGFFSKSEEKESIEIIRKWCGVIGCLEPKDSLDVLASDGSTPLIQAVIHSLYGLVKLFLELGSDPYIKDSKGMTASSWCEWIKNPRIKTLFERYCISEEDQRCTNNLNSCISQSSMNAQVLFLPSKPFKPIELQSSGIDERMENTIHSLQDVNYNDSEELDKKSLETQIIWNAKIFTCGVVASGNSILSPPLIMGLCMFTNNSFISKKINSSIASAIYSNGKRKEIENGDSNGEKILNSLKIDSSIKGQIDIMCNALSNLPPFVGETFMGVNVVDRNLFQIGNEISFPGFLSTSSLWRVATEHVKEFSTKKKEGTIFIVKSKTGRFVGQYSEFSYDSEVLYRPFTKFKVTNLYHGDIICLGQSNIREHTFQIKSEHTRWGESERKVQNLHETMEMMMSSNKSMIIELEEIDINDKSAESKSVTPTLSSFNSKTDVKII